MAVSFRKFQTDHHIGKIADDITNFIMPQIYLINNFSLNSKNVPTFRKCGYFTGKWR